MNAWKAAVVAGCLALDTVSVGLAQDAGAATQTANPAHQGRRRTRASFAGLGDLPGGEHASYASAVSSNGEIVVGFSRNASGDEAVRWTQTQGLEGLGGPDSQAHGISPDGNLIAGSVAEASYAGGRAAVIWRGEEAFDVLTGPTLPDGTPVFFVVDGVAVLDDARVFGTCIQSYAYGEPLACRFDSPGNLEVFFGGHVFAADAAGHFAGTLNAVQHAPFSSRAVYDETALPYPARTVCEPLTGCEAEARAFAADGSVIVGTSQLPEPSVRPRNTKPSLSATAFAYTTREGSVRLRDLPGGDKKTGAYAVSADGRVIGGFATIRGRQVAVLWVNRAPRQLEDVLRRAGGQLPRGWSLREVRGMSPDGRTVVGNAVNAEGKPEGFWMALPEAP